MVEKGYVPDAGHIAWLRFSPHAGHEQAGHRPALVLSPLSYNMMASLALFCPITSRAKGHPFEVLLPDSGAITGVVLADQIRSLDWRVRGARFEADALPETVSEVRRRLADLIGY